jgi:hypothetical protein
MKKEHHVKRRVTVTLAPHLLERTKDAVYWLRGQTLAGMIAESLERNLSRLRRLRGRDFPKRKGPLRAGRPRNSRRA